MPNPNKSDIYVERSDTSKAYEVFQQSQARLGDMQGPHGVGKTTVLRHMHDQLKDNRDKKIYSAYASLGGYVTVLQPGDEELHHQLVTLEKYRALLLAVAGDLPASTGLEQAINAAVGRLAPAQKGAVHPKTLDVGFSVPVLGISIGPKFSLDLDQLFKGAQLTPEHLSSVRLALTASFQNTLRQWTEKTGGRILLFLDDFHALKGTLLEKWLLEELLPKLEGVQVIVGRTGDRSPLSGSPMAPESIPIHNFTAGESRDYVARRSGAEALEKGWAESIFGYTQGNPLITVLLCDVLEQQYPPGALPEPDQVHWLKQSAQGELVKLATLVDELAGSPDSPQAQALNLACILREFDAAALKALMSGPFSIEELWTWLRGLSVVQSSGSKLLHIHDLMGRVRENWLCDNRVGYVEDVHQRAAAHFGQRMSDIEEDCCEGIWEREHRYEKPDWQYLSRRWLYHLSHAEADQASAELATRYFDAFFWWGEYLPFPFCARILSDLEQAELPEKSNRWLGLLRRFHRLYVPARLRTGDTTWARSARALLGEARSRAHLHDSAGLTPALLHLKGLVDSYMADVMLIENPQERAAVDSYLGSIAALDLARQAYQQQYDETPAANRAARRMLAARARREGWFSAWMKVWLTNLYAALGDSQAALETAGQAETELQQADPDDLEGLARIHLGRGEALRKLGRFDEALVEYCGYARCAMGFLIDDYSNGADAYTFEFLREMVERVAAALGGVQQSDPAAARRLWRGLKSYWCGDCSDLLPQGVAEEIPEKVGDAIELDAHGRVLSHRLPLPALPMRPPDQPGELLAVELPEALKERIKEAYYLMNG